MLKQRVLTAVVAVPFLLWVFLAASVWTQAGLFILVSALSFRELFAVLVLRLHTEFALNERNLRNFQVLQNVLSLLVVIFSVASSIFFERNYIQGVLVLLVSFVSILPLIVIFLDLSIDVKLHLSALIGFTTAYTVVPWLVFSYFTFQPLGGHWIILLLAIVWMSDTGGYFGGRYFGRRALAPQLSPKKTVEGSVAGVLAAVIVAVIALFLYPSDLFGPWYLLIPASIIVAVVGQAGDLFESLAKRYALVKDSGDLIPGHGGILDRVDAVLSAAPIFWLYHLMVTGLSLS